MPEYDIILIGAGLSSGVMALRLSQMPNSPRILILEKDERPFGSKRWSLHQTDLGSKGAPWLQAAIATTWDKQAVRFQRHERELPTPYLSVTSESLRAAVAVLENVTVECDVEVRSATKNSVRLQGGESIAARLVLDARGFTPRQEADLAYQKFLGLTVETKDPHGIGYPVTMDARVEQIDGYRFIYLLPLSPTVLLIEDTRFADTPDLDTAALETCIEDYAAAQGWVVADIKEREAGVLPMTLSEPSLPFTSDTNQPHGIGMAAGFFHPGTGYSFPDAIRVANIVEESWPSNVQEISPRLRDYRRRQAKRQTFYRFLNRMLFRGAHPSERHVVLEKFYRLPVATIERFYAGQTTVGDVFRILSGKPPIPIRRAISCIPANKKATTIS